jgi:tryptophan halogenase
MNKPVNTVLVLGGGSAGFLAAITLKRRLPSLEVVVLRSNVIGIIGVGEGTTVTIPQHLHQYLQIDIREFFREAQPQWKLGIRYYWGPRPFFDYVFGFQIDTKYRMLPKTTGYYYEDPLAYVGIPSGLMSENKIFLRETTGIPNVSNEPAYHIENEKFVAFLEKCAQQLGIQIHDDTVEHVVRGEQGIQELRLASGGSVTADLFVDCSGFASVLLGKTLGVPYLSFKRSLFNDRAVVGGWTRSDEPIKPYTTAETMTAGWCWQIEHEFLINRGYVYSSDFISDEDAEAEFRAKNPKLEKTRIVRFKSGRYERTWVDNVVAIGNASGFVEPLEATGLGLICSQAQALVEMLRADDLHINPSLVKHYDLRVGKMWEQIVNFLAVHYKFNTRLDTPYWRACQNDAELGWAEEIVDYYQAVGPSVVARETLLDYHDQFGMEGYLTMLVGQCVPYNNPYQPPPEERMNWARIQQAVKNKVATAYTVREALDFVRSDYWRWPANLYARAPGRGTTIGTAREL